MDEMTHIIDADNYYQQGGKGFTEQRDFQVPSEPCLLQTGPDCMITLNGFWPAGRMSAAPSVIIYQRSIKFTSPVKRVCFVEETALLADEGGGRGAVQLINDESMDAHSIHE